jgi:hypothetical protein
MLSYLFSSKKPVTDGLPNHKSCSLVYPAKLDNQTAGEQATLSPLGRGSEAEQSSQKNLVEENEKLKSQNETLLAEKSKLEKELEYLKRECSVYRDLMFSKACTCNSHN